MAGARSEDDGAGVAGAVAVVDAGTGVATGGGAPNAGPAQSR